MQDSTDHAIREDSRDAPSSQAEAAQTRLDTYALLAGLLRNPPAPEMIELLRGLGPQPEQERRTTDLQAAWKGLAEAAARADAESVELEFNRLFIGLGRGELLPYGSYYLSGFLMDKPLADLRDELARLGIQRADGVSEPEDHAAALCETMALLADPEHGVPLSRQKEFFDIHVGAWMPRFFGEMQDAKGAAFYVPVGRLGVAFMEFERVWLSLPE